MKPYKELVKDNPIKKSLDYVKNNGISGVLSKVRYKMTGPGLAYNGWYREKHEPDEEELLRQREDKLAYEPLISILVPVYLTPELFLRGMLESVLNQTYSNWELCIVDGSKARVEEMPMEDTTAYEYVYSLETEKIIRQLAEEDDRIKYHMLSENQGICGSLNTALRMANGEYVVFLYHDDLLAEDALYEIARALNEQRFDFLYSDEDKCSSDGLKFSDPSFKPDFSIDLIRTYNYIGHLVAVKREIALRVGFRKELEGCEDYDFVLRCLEDCVEGIKPDKTHNPINSSNIKHISRVLYHARIKTKSIETSGHKKSMYAEYARKVLAQHLERTVGLATVTRTSVDGMYKAVYETPGNPLVSIIIPGIEDVEVMSKCILPLYERLRYSSFEIIILDTQGDDNRETSTFYRKIEGQRKNIKVITETAAKNTAQLRNRGAGFAKGDFLLFLDANLELIDTTAVGEMVGNCLRREVGIAGGTIYTPNETIYKQGIFIGVNGAADYPNMGIKKGSYGYMMSNCLNMNYSAVSSACMMVKTVVFDSLGGFSDEYTGDASAIDFCLKVRELGLIIVSIAGAGFICHEQRIRKRPRGINEENEKMLKDRWALFYENGDPYYNRNLTRNGEIFDLA